MGWRRACLRSSSSCSASPTPSPTARMAGAARVPARPSGSSAISIRTTRVTGIDWRRSASSDHLFVREREWEAAHTVWLWVDLSPSMRFRSSLAKVTKESRVGGAGARACRAAGPRRRARRRVRRPALHRARRRAPRRRSADGRYQRCEPAAERQAEPLFGVPAVQRFPRADARDRPSGSRRSPRKACAAISSRCSIPPRRRLPYAGRTEFAASEGRDRVIAGRAETLREQLSGTAQAPSHRSRRTDAAARLVLPRASHRPAARRGGAGRCTTASPGSSGITAIGPPAGPLAG